MIIKVLKENAKVEVDKIEVFKNRQYPDVRH